MYLTVTFFGILCLLVCGNCAENDVIRHEKMKHSTNSSTNNTDMYVVHAIVYQVGILTNKTDDEPINENFTGKQEAITFYHNEGSKLDLTKIGNPLVTNVSARDMVGISRNSDKNINFNATRSTWIPFNKISSFMNPTRVNGSGKMNSSLTDASNVYKRSVAAIIKNETTVIPEEVEIKSIEIPPLLVLNNKFSKIPVPIPNTSVVSYAMVNTLVRTP